MTEKELHQRAREVVARNEEALRRSEQTSRVLRKDIERSHARSQRALKVLQDAGLVRSRPQRSSAARSRNGAFDKQEPV